VTRLTCKDVQLWIVFTLTQVGAKARVYEAFSVLYTTQVTDVVACHFFIVDENTLQCCFYDIVGQRSMVAGSICDHAKLDSKLALFDVDWKLQLKKTPKEHRHCVRDEHAAKVLTAKACLLHDLQRKVEVLVLINLEIT
jgi:hypothetical protein